MVFKQGVGHIVALPFTFKKYLKTKEELWKLKYFTMQKMYSSKKSSKRNQNPSRYYNFVTNCKFQNKPKYYLSKILYFIKIELLLLLPRGQNPLSYYTL
jgi:hypothetical protein